MSDTAPTLETSGKKKRLSERKYGGFWLIMEVLGERDIKQLPRQEELGPTMSGRVCSDCIINSRDF